METLSLICKMDKRYREVIKECYLVKNALVLLGGRRRRNGGEKERKEGEREKEKEGEKRKKEGRWNE